MPLQCTQCGETDFRDGALFCDKCGAKLNTVLSDGATMLAPDSPDIDDNRFATLTDDDAAPLLDGATMMMPDTRGLDNDALTTLMPADTTPAPEGATMMMPDSRSLDDANFTTLTDKDATPSPEGATLMMPDSRELDDDGLTTLLPNDTSPAPQEDTAPQGVTMALSDTRTPDQERIEADIIDTVDDDSTKFMPDTREAEGDGLTKVIPEVDTVDTDPQKQGVATHADKTIKEGQAKRVTSDTDQANITTSLKTGQLLQKRYRLQKILGRGGFGAAYLAEDVKLKRACVVKQMLTPKGISPLQLERHRANFEREASLLVQLNEPGHPNIPEIYDYFFENTDSYLVMKYIGGRNLKDILAQNEKKIPWRQAVRYIIDVCSALNYMHTISSEPVMHRDIKPANIILGDDGRVWLIDFGLAKAEEVQDAAGDMQATQASGSLGYTPLEQWFGEAVPASDVYAVGATLHHLITGINPLTAYGDTFDIEKIHDLHSQFAPIRKIDRKLPPRLEQVISQATTAKPDERPTPLQLQQQLEVIISGARGAVLYTFKNGKSAKTVGQLVDLCEENRQEAMSYLYNGNFERWFLLINRNDLAEAATKAIKQGKNQKAGLERFLKLILPNLFTRRLVKAGWQLTRLTVQFILILVIVVLLVAGGGSYAISEFLQQSIGGTAWDFSTLDLDQDNHYPEEFLAKKFNELVGSYISNLQVDLQPPDKLDINGNWTTFPLKLSTSIRRTQTTPRLYLLALNDLPLLWFGNNISSGINNGIEQAFQNGPVDVTQLIVRDDKIDFRVIESNDPNRPDFATATPAPTATPTPTPTATPALITLVVIFNDLNQDITLEVEGEVWHQTIDIAANDTEVIEPPGGIYKYTVKDKVRQEIMAQGTKNWIRDKAYRLSLDLLQAEETE